MAEGGWPLIKSGKSFTALLSENLQGSNQSLADCKPCGLPRRSQHCFRNCLHFGGSRSQPWGEGQPQMRHPGRVREPPGPQRLLEPSLRAPPCESAPELGRRACTCWDPNSHAIAHSVQGLGAATVGEDTTVAK